MAQNISKLELPIFEEYYGESHKDSYPVPKGITHNLKFTNIQDSITFEPYISKVATWYKADVISDVEQNAFPELLKDEHNRNIYMSSRNSIIELYRGLKGKMLTIKEAKRVASYDILTLMNIFVFLEKHELINYKIEEFKCIKKVIKQDTNEKPTLKPELISKTCICGVSENLYISQKDLQLICKKCLENGVYGGNNTYGGFVKYGREYVGNTWNKYEEMLLIDLLEESHKWDHIAEQLGRTPEQCLLRFLTIDTKEEFVDKELVEFSFDAINKMPNPVMNLIALVCGSVSPKMANIVAKRILENIDQRNIISSDVIELCKEYSTMLKDAEKIKLQRLQKTLIELQKSKLETKLNEYEELLGFVEKERNDNEYARKTIVREASNLKYYL